MTVFVSLVSAYYHLNDNAVMKKLMNEEGLNYIPAIDIRGIMIPHIDPFTMNRFDEKPAKLKNLKIDKTDDR